MGYGIGYIRSSIAPWRWLFIIFDGATFLWGIVLLIFFPDSPLNARFPFLPRIILIPEAYPLHDVPNHVSYF